MKKVRSLLLLTIVYCCSLVSFTSSSPLQDKDPLIGAWRKNTKEATTVMICTGNVFSIATYDYPGKKFIHATGGTWRREGNRLIQQVEWDSQDSTQVGTAKKQIIRTDGDQLSVGENNETWQRLDNGTPGALQGAWIITGNFSNDKVSKRANPFYPRRTMKVLSGKYFHWIAYNVATRQFLNAGGGTYTTANGQYIENIEFFTKTAESIGKTLQFSYSFAEGDWRHRGEKSTGGLLDECWSRRETLEH